MNRSRWNKIYPNVAYGQEIYKFNKYIPVIELKEFDFYRIIQFNKTFYGKTISEIHKGNLRKSRSNNRYSQLFKNSKKISYWSSDIETAKKEFKFHNKNIKNIIIFHSYDDYSSTFPILGISENLKIIDWRLNNFDVILSKYENNEKLSNKEIEIIDNIEKYNPDCIAYKSKRSNDGINFMFFEKGFKKLALRNVELKINYNNKNIVTCAFWSDYKPCLENYGMCFSPIAKIKKDVNYIKSKEYKLRKKRCDEHPLNK